MRKVRLTGGEPLLRRDLPVLVRLLAGIAGLEDIALTTNGLLVAAQAEGLRQAGLQRVRVSIDALDDALFRRMTRARPPVLAVPEAMRAAQRSGLGVKVNCVVRHGVNEDEVLPLAALCRREGWMLRFIEFMDGGNHNRWERADGRLVTCLFAADSAHDRESADCVRGIWSGRLDRQSELRTEQPGGSRAKVEMSYVGDVGG